VEDEQTPETESEHEFGVPFPGQVLPPEAWSKTALKKLPTPGQWNAEVIFGRTAPLILDIGCGNGRSALHLAISHPECNVLGSDVLPVVIRYATRRGNQRGLSNLKFAVCGGKELLRDHLEQLKCREIHCYHPQPYYSRSEIRKRLITPDFLSMVYQILEPEGVFVIQTDHPAYWKYMQEVIPEFLELEEKLSPWEDAPLGRTRREILARSQNLPIFRGIAKKRKIMTAHELTHLVTKLPWPRFNADRRYQKIDRMEQEKKN
jgi:tRNA (guanine-N7-)-methyltransferase